jgi:hypothetical protein
LWSRPPENFDLVIVDAMPEKYAGLDDDLAVRRTSKLARISLKVIR